MSSGEQESKALAPVTPRAELVKASGVDGLLAIIRPEWQAKNLIQRVRRLLPVDPSSACQRILNAAIHDLRDKIVIAGLDIAKEAADRFKLPSIARQEDVLENYSAANTIDLAYRMGLLSRPEWRRFRRAYEIRRDLEHEDDQYEAEIEDLIYIFKSSVEIVLSREPVELIRLSDVQDLVDAPNRAVPSQEFLQDFDRAPEPRQRQIVEHLINTALNSGKADIIRQNAVELMRVFRPVTKRPVQVELAQELQKRITRGRVELVVAKVAYAAGLLPYLKQRGVTQLFDWLRERLVAAGHQWRQFPQHEAILDDLEDVGGLMTCPPEVRPAIVLWMVLCYIGEPGGYGQFGRHRPVFYSDVAATRIHSMFTAAGATIQQDLATAEADPRVKTAIKNQYVARRLEQLRDLVAGEHEE